MSLVETPFTCVPAPLHNCAHEYTGCAKKKKDILNIHIKSEKINIFSQKFCWTESTIFVVKCQKFTFIV